MKLNSLPGIFYKLGGQYISKNEKVRTNIKIYVITYFSIVIDSRILIGILGKSARHPLQTNVIIIARNYLANIFNRILKICLLNY